MRYRLSKEEQAKGIRKALVSRRTPVQLKAALRRRLITLLKESGRRRRR
jgi:hypothetical protein